MTETEVLVLAEGGDSCRGGGVSVGVLLEREGGQVSSSSVGEVAGARRRGRDGRREERPILPDRSLQNTPEQSQLPNAYHIPHVRAHLACHHVARE